MLSPCLGRVSWDIFCVPGSFESPGAILKDSSIPVPRILSLCSWGRGEGGGSATFGELGRVGEEGKRKHHGAWERKIGEDMAKGWDESNREEKMQQGVVRRNIKRRRKQWPQDSREKQNKSLRHCA